MHIDWLYTISLRHFIAYGYFCNFINLLQSHVMFVPFIIFSLLFMLISARFRICQIDCLAQISIGQHFLCLHHLLVKVYLNQLRLIGHLWVWMTRIRSVTYLPRFWLHNPVTAFCYHYYFVLFLFIYLDFVVAFLLVFGGMVLPCCWCVLRYACMIYSRSKFFVSQ